jgi:hypothetical protein
MGRSVPKRWAQVDFSAAKEVLSQEAWNANSALTFYKLLKNLRQTAKLLPLVHPQTNVKYMVDWPFVEGDLERQAMLTYLGGQGAVNVALRKTINDLVYTYLIKLLTPCWPRIEKALVLTDYDDDASPQPHLYLQGASSPFHPQPRVPPPLFFSPLPCDRCNPCLQRTVSRDVCARPFTLQGASFSSCAPCVLCQKQRVSPGLLRAAPRLACARPRSGRSPLPSDCTRGNPCLLARNLAAGARPCRASSSDRPLGTSAPGATHVCSECSSGTPARDHISHVRSACSSGTRSAWSSGTPAHVVCMHPAHVRSYSGRSPLR